MVKYWQNKLGLNAWTIKVERIDDSQVTYPDDCVGDEKYYIGVEPNHKTKEATIYHMRDLTEEDILHELLHVANPSKSEDWVNATTDKMLKNKK